MIKGVKNILQFKDGWVVRHVTFYSNGLKEKDISFRPKSVEMNKYLNPPRGTKRGKFSEWHRNGKKKTEFHYDDSGLQIGTQTIWHTDGTKIAQTTYEINDGKLRPQKRCDPLGRIGRLRSGGGKPSTAVTVIKGLRWLQSIQDDDGGWGNQDRDREGKPFKNNGLQRDALTALSLIAYLSHCELPDSPEFGDTVQRGIDFLTSTPSDKLGKFDSNGEFIGLDDPDNDGSFSHPLRAYALCKAYTFTKFPELKELAVKAISIVLGGKTQMGDGHPDLTKRLTLISILPLLGGASTQSVLLHLLESLDHQLMNALIKPSNTSKPVKMNPEHFLLITELKKLVMESGSYRIGRMLNQKKPSKGWTGLSKTRKKTGKILIYMSGITGLELAFNPLL